MISIDLPQVDLFLFLDLFISLGRRSSQLISRQRRKAREELLERTFTKSIGLVERVNFNATRISPW